VLSLVGGKWTTFRAFAEQVTDKVLAELGRPRRVSTTDLAIGGGTAFPADAAARKRWIEGTLSQVPVGAARLEQLLSRYGTTARKVADFCRQADDAPLSNAADYSDREIRYLIRFEMVRTLEDLIYRRSMMAMEGRLDFPLMTELARIIADERGLDRNRQEVVAGILHPAIHRLRRDNGIDFSHDLEAFTVIRRHAEIAG